MKYRIFIVEDDRVLAQELEKALSKWGFEVILAIDFEKILEEVVRTNPQVVLMDINIPYFDGFYWCSKIREVSHVPILFTSSRDSDMDIIMAMNTGGDEYLPKPFNLNVLVAKIQAIIRRTYEYAKGETQLLECHGLMLNLEDASMRYQGNPVELTKNEFKILKLLIQNQGKLVSRENIMKKLWDDEVYVNENTLNVNVNRVRSKLEDIGLKDFITTKKGMGYMVL